MIAAGWKRASRSWAPIVLVMGGCHGGAGPQTPGAALPSWLAELPRRSVEAAPGERVWAVVPQPGSEAAEVATYRIETVADGEAVLVDELDRRFEGVPGALVHSVSRLPKAELTAGTAVLADRWDARKVVGRVAGLAGGEVRVAYDWNGSTATGVMDAVVLLPGAAGESSVLRWVAYRKDASAAWYKGLCFAEGADQVWISDDGGFVEIVGRDAVRVLADLGQTEHQVGAAVAAYTWGHGYRSGVIESVLEPGLRYAVKLEDGRSRSFFFSDLTTAL